MNPQSEGRQKLVSKLRVHAGWIEDEGHAIDLNQAANEVEYLGKIAEHEVAAFVWRLKQCLSGAVTQFMAQETEGYEPFIQFTHEEPNQGDGAFFMSMAAHTGQLSVLGSLGLSSREPDLGPLQMAVEVRVIRHGR